MNIRKLKKKDFKLAKKWWKAWPEWTAPAEDFLPETGLVVESNKEPVMIGFIYLTNAKVALLEWIVSDPDYREDNRKQLLKLLILGAENMLKEMDYKYVFSVCKNQNLINTHKDLGWSVDKKPSRELVKVLN